MREDNQVLKKVKYPAQVLHKAKAWDAKQQFFSWWFIVLKFAITSCSIVSPVWDLYDANLKGVVFWPLANSAGDFHRGYFKPRTPAQNGRQSRARERDLIHTPIIIIRVVETHLDRVIGTIIIPSEKIDLSQSCVSLSFLLLLLD